MVAIHRMTVLGLAIGGVTVGSITVRADTIAGMAIHCWSDVSAACPLRA